MFGSRHCPFPIICSPNSGNQRPTVYNEKQEALNDCSFKNKNQYILLYSLFLIWFTTSKASACSLIISSALPFVFAQGITWLFVCPSLVVKMSCDIFVKKKTGLYNDKKWCVSKILSFFDNPPAPVRFNPPPFSPIPLECFQQLSLPWTATPYLPEHQEYNSRAAQILASNY